MAAWLRPEIMPQTLVCNPKTAPIYKTAAVAVPGIWSPPTGVHACIIMHMQFQSDPNVPFKTRQLDRHACKGSVPRCCAIKPA